MRSPIDQNDKAKVDAALKTQRARYIALTKMGYTNRQIANAYQVSQNRVWQAINSNLHLDEAEQLAAFK